MRTCSQFTTCLLTAFISLVVSYDVHQSFNKWQDLAEISQQLRLSLQQSVQKIIKTATNDNPVVGSRISETIYETLSKILSILDQLDDGIGAQTLTSDDADGMFQQLFEIFMECQAKIGTDVEQLSDSAETWIDDLLVKCGDTVLELTDDIRAILIEMKIELVSEK